MTSVSCGTYPTLREFFINGEFLGGWTCAMTGGDPATELLFFSLIFGGVELALFVSSGSIVLPAILSILVGGIMFGLLPATFANMALVGVLLLLGSLGLLIFFRSGT